MSRQENDKDTRALESTYLARGLARRVASLEETRGVLAVLKLRRFGPDDPVALSALVVLQDDAGSTTYFLTPAGGGREIEIDGRTVKTVTPQAPLGRALLGSYLGDEVQAQTPDGPRQLEVSELS